MQEKCFFMGSIRVQRYNKNCTYANFLLFLRMSRRTRLYIRSGYPPKNYFGKGRAESTTKIAFMQIKSNVSRKKTLFSCIYPQKAVSLQAKSK